MTVSLLLAAVLLADAPAAPAQAAPSAPPPVDLAALGPTTRKPQHEKQDRQGIDALFHALDASLEKGDLPGYVAAMDFPITLVTDGANGAPLVLPLEREAFEKAVGGQLKPPPHLKVASKRTVVVLSDVLAQVVDETTLTLGKTKATSRSVALVVHREGGWRIKVLAEPGWDDCCPFWDDDGQGWLVGSNFRDGYKIHLWKLTADGRDLIRASDRVIYQSKGSEANKLYKINGVYYHFFSEVHPEGRVIMMQRASSVTGPYTEKQQLKHADRAVMEPNQGGFLDGPDGRWYFFTHHGRGDWEGRAASLLSVTWRAGWPMVGAIGADGLGNMVWSGKMPVPGTSVETPQTSDEFSLPGLSPQ